MQAQVDYENAVSRLNKVKQQSKVDVKKYNQAVAEMTQVRAGPGHWTLVWTTADPAPAAPRRCTARLVVPTVPHQV